jgi:hypothetical protein
MEAVDNSFAGADFQKSYMALLSSAAQELCTVKGDSNHLQS